MGHWIIFFKIFKLFLKSFEFIFLIIFNYLLNLEFIKLFLKFLKLNLGTVGVILSWKIAAPQILDESFWHLHNP